MIKNSIEEDIKGSWEEVANRTRNTVGKEELDEYLEDR